VSNTEIFVGPYSNDSNRGLTNRRTLKENKNAHRIVRRGWRETWVDFVSGMKDEEVVIKTKQFLLCPWLGVDFEVRGRKREKTNGLALNLFVVMFLSIT